MFPLRHHFVSEKLMFVTIARIFASTDYASPSQALHERTVPEMVE